jgi:hypothetical protein
VLVCLCVYLYHTNCNHKNVLANTKKLKILHSKGPASDTYPRTIPKNKKNAKKTQKGEKSNIAGAYFCAQFSKKKKPLTRLTKKFTHCKGPYLRKAIQKQKKNTKKAHLKAAFFQRFFVVA